MRKITTVCTGACYRSESCYEASAHGGRNKGAAGIMGRAECVRSEPGGGGLSYACFRTERRSAYRVQPRTPSGLCRNRRSAKRLLGIPTVPGPRCANKALPYPAGTDFDRLISIVELWLPPRRSAHQASAKRNCFIRAYQASLGSGYGPVQCFDTLDHDLILRQSGT